MKTIALGILGVGLVALALPLAAGTVTWVGPSGGNWMVATNWAPTNVPGAGDDVLVSTNGGALVVLAVSSYEKASSRQYKRDEGDPSL
jgi:hypothetical protein